MTRWLFPTIISLTIIIFQMDFLVTKRSFILYTCCCVKNAEPYWKSFTSKFWGNQGESQGFEDALETRIRYHLRCGKGRQDRQGCVTNEGEKREEDRRSKDDIDYPRWPTRRRKDKPFSLSLSISFRSRKSPFDIVNLVFARLPLLELIFRPRNMGCEVKPTWWGDNDVNTISDSDRISLFSGKLETRKSCWEKALSRSSTLRPYLLILTRYLHLILFEGLVILR